MSSPDPRHGLSVRYKRAPWPLVQRAFERLYQERLTSVAPKFFAMLRTDE